MMAAFNVSTINLADYGYPEQADFSDPMSELFCAKPYTGTNIGQVESVLLPYYQNLDAYPDAAYVQSALDAYYTSLPKSTTKTFTTVTTTPTTFVTTTKAPTVTSTTKAPTTTKSEDKPKTTTSTTKKDDDKA
jgi:bilirubin oxidase